MAHQRVARLGTEPGDNVDHALWETGLLGERRKLQRRGRCEFRWFDDDGVARGQRRRRLPGQQQQRRVPGRDARAHPQRLVTGQVENVRLVDGRHRTLDLVGQSAVVMKPLSQVTALIEHLRMELAVVPHLDLRQSFGVVGQDFGEPSEHQSALRGIQCGPLALPECVVGSLDGGLDIGGAGTRNSCPGVARIGVGRVDPFPGQRVGPGAVDVQLVFLHPGNSPRSNRLPPCAAIKERLCSSRGGFSEACRPVQNLL